ncbi:MAG: DUF1080 domain-containing protein [Phycisphaerae bacterium]|jgi:hypothetical protein|nr:DUF1080 domain-containing protein [Phycisphaerae bacterium]
MNREASETKCNRSGRRDFLKTAAAAAGGISIATLVPTQWAQAEAAKKTGGWEVLFGGGKLDKWDYNPKAWQVKDEELYSPGKGGDIFSKKKYQDFTLDIEFKMSKGCNSGVFVRMASRKDWLHSSMEIQVLDSHGKGKIGKHDCGAVYDALVPSVNAAKKAGEWNRYFITCFKNRVFISLNGVQIIDMDLNKWDTARKNPDGSKNKFRAPLKTLTHAGFFALQTHGKPVWYKNIRVKELKSLGKCPCCGFEGPIGWYCGKCNTVCAAPAKLDCKECKKKVPAGTFCKGNNAFHLPDEGVECSECGNKPGMVCEMSDCGYSLCMGVKFCDECEKPFANKGAGCPECAKKKKK